MPPPEVTVVVPVKDRRERMVRCLDALQGQDHPSYEVLVVDNGSTDGTLEACRQRAAESAVPMRVVQLLGKLGRVRNEAAAMVGTEFVAFTDSDCLPEAGWLSAATAVLRDDPSLGVVQGRTLPEVEPDRGWPVTLRVEGFTHRYEGANLVFRRRALVESEGFDEDIGYFWEDTAAGYALRRRGWNARFVPDAVVRHDVTYAGFWHHVRRMQANRNLAAVVRRYPELRRDLLFWRVFLAPRDARFAGLLAGLVLGRVDRRLLVLGLPYLVSRVKDDDRLAIRPTILNPRSHAQAVVYDTARLVGVLRGALRHRTLVL